MSSHQLSSGDMLADRRADYARMMAENGEYAGAAELIEQALERAPGWAAGWFRLGEYREKAGDRQGAAEAYRAVTGLDPADPFGATLKLAVLGTTAMPAHPPSRYVEQLFDDYATRFDTALVERLGYSVPKKLAALIEAHAGPQRPCFECTVDLGCGTGLLGVEIRTLTRRLEGYDLSRGMLREAEEKAVYDHLAQADLSLEPQHSGLLADGFPPQRADLVTAADVLMYLGDLDPPLALAAQLARPGAMIAFSVEDGGEGEGFRLGETLRYAHGSAYVKGRLLAHGFSMLAEQKTVIRQDAGNPVHGILYLAINP